MNRKEWKSHWEVVALVTALGAVAAMLLPNLMSTLYPPRPRKWGRTPQAERLHELGLSLIAYAYMKGHRLPPVAVFAKDGRPLLSWRVLVLPFLGEEKLYRQFRLDEPWNSLHNIALLARMPTQFPAVSPKRPPKPYHTFVHALVGKGTAFEGTTGLKFPDDFPDGVSKTILLILGGDPVPWAKPEGISYAADQPSPDLGAVCDDGFYVVMVDGSVRFIVKKTSEKTLRAAITRNGNDLLGPDW
jgi:hypothetical protein